MKLIHVQVLAEVADNTWFEHQTKRWRANPEKYDAMKNAFGELMKSEHLEFTKDTLKITPKGKDFLEGLEEVMRKYSY